VTRKGEYYPYNGYFMKGMFLHFINRVLNPTIHLQSKEEIIKFMDSPKEYREDNEFYLQKYEEFGAYYPKMGKNVRVIAFFNDKKEYKNEYKLFTEAAQKLSERDDLRIAYVTDKELIKEFKAMYGSKWFDGYTLNSIVLEREKDVFFNYNMEEDSSDIYYWINKMSLNKAGDDCNRETQIISKLLNEAEGLLYYKKSNKGVPHLSDEAADSIVAKNALERVAPFYFGKMNFFFV
jgi:hypothetical protein